MTIEIITTVLAPFAIHFLFMLLFMPFVMYAWAKYLNHDPEEEAIRDYLDKVDPGWRNQKTLDDFSGIRNNILQWTKRPQKTQTLITKSSGATYKK
jgi:hypothetical protein